MALFARDGWSLTPRDSFVPSHTTYVQYPSARGQRITAAASIPSQRQWYEDHVVNTNLSLYRANTRFLAKQRSPRRLAPLQTDISPRLYQPPASVLATGPGALRALQEQDKMKLHAKQRRRIPWLVHDPLP